jgi:hypothetical protein
MEINNMVEYLTISLIVWLWILCGWSSLEEFCKQDPVAWKNFNTAKKLIAFCMGPIILTVAIFSPKFIIKE